MRWEEKDHKILEIIIFFYLNKTIKNKKQFTVHKFPSLKYLHRILIYLNSYESASSDGQIPKEVFLDNCSRRLIHFNIFHILLSVLFIPIFL